MFYCLLAFTRPKAGREGSRSTKLDSGAQKCLRWSPIEGYRPHIQASTWLARAEVGLLPGVCTNWDRRPLRSPALLASADCLKIDSFAPFSQFLHIKGLNFRMFFIRLHLPMIPMNHEKFHGNRSALFWAIQTTDTDIYGWDKCLWPEVCMWWQSSAWMIKL